MTRTERAVVALQALPKATRQHLGEVWKQTPPTGREALVDLILNLDRQRRRSESDARTDRERRVLIGARLPRDVVGRYRLAADRCGQSLYAWVADALAAHAARTSPQNHGEGGAPRAFARFAPPGGFAAAPGCGRASQGAAAPCTPAQRPGLRPDRRGRRCGRGTPRGARRPPAPVRKSRGANRPGT